MHTLKFQHARSNHDKSSTWLFSLLLLIVSLLFLPTQVFADSAGPVRVELHSQVTQLARPLEGEQKRFLLGYTFSIEPGWHIYWQNSGESAFPTSIETTLSNGWTSSSLSWPTPQIFYERADLRTYGHTNEATLLQEIQAESPAAYQAGSIDIHSEIKWLVCNDICVPGSVTLKRSVPFGTNTIEDGNGAQKIKTEKSKIPFYSLSQLQQKHEETKELKVTAYKSKDALYLELTGLAKQLDKNQIQFFPYSLSSLAKARPLLSLGQDNAVIKLSASSIDPTPGELSGVFVLKSSEKNFAFSWSEKIQGFKEATPELKQPKVPFAESEFLVAKHKNKDKKLSQESTKEIPPTTTKGLSALFLALLFAVIGGTFLNLMPCVLPIISIKVLGFVCSAERNPKQIKKNALYFVAGIFATFLSLAAIVITLRSLGMQLGWGFQFQHAEFVLALTLIVFVLALGFFDFYYIPLGYISESCKKVDALSPSPKKHFFDGILATILSTPCTAPFLGSAVAFAFTQSAGYTILVHLAIALGLSWPYYFLATHPNLIERLPKPGEWMNSIKQLMGFCLLGTVVWLLFVLHQLTGLGSLWCTVLFLIVSFALWLLKTLQKKHPKTAISLFLLILIPTLFFGFPLISKYPPGKSSDQRLEEGSIAWSKFSDNEVKSALARGETVFLNFTAAWCITCKSNDLFVLSSSEVADAFQSNNVTAFRADWTDGNPEITKALSKYGASGIPLYVVLHPGKAQPKILATILSTEEILNAI